MTDGLQKGANLMISLLSKFKSEIVTDVYNQQMRVIFSIN